MSAVGETNCDGIATSSFKVAVIVGSLRKGSYNRQVAKVMAAIAAPSPSFEFIEIGNLPLYNEDVETDGIPRAWAAFRQAVQACDAVLFVTPEFNRSVPGGPKNALDVGSRPYGKSVWNDKPGAVISVSRSAIGGFGANHHLRQSLVALNVPAMAQPEAYIGGAATLFDAAGALADRGTHAFLEAFVKSFTTWIEKLVVPTNRASTGV